jgi:hypothetical protein
MAVHPMVDLHQRSEGWILDLGDVHALDALNPTSLGNTKLGAGGFAYNCR